MIKVKVNTKLNGDMKINIKYPKSNVDVEELAAASIVIDAVVSKLPNMNSEAFNNIKNNLLDKNENKVI